MTTTDDGHHPAVPATVAPSGTRPDDATVVSLLGRCATGEVDALADLYDATSAMVYRLSLLVLGDQGRAVASTRRTYSTVWEQSSRYTGPREGSALSWLVTVAYTHARTA